jgi:hypothetical protein
LGSDQVLPGADDSVWVIVSKIRDVETGLDPAVLEATVHTVGGRRARMRQLANALADRPGVLTDGRSPAPQCVGDLLIALRKAGARRISAPVCATSGCGRELSSMQRRGQDWYCSGCKRERLQEECAGCSETKPVNTRGPDGRGYCWSCARKDAPDSLAGIVKVVIKADPGLPAGVVTAAVLQAAPGMMARRKLAWALLERPGLLTGDGASAPARSVLRLIDALTDAGATGIVKPACPRCGGVKRLTGKLEKVRVCASCYARSRAVTCSRCGHVRPPHTRDTEGRPVCSNCRARDPANKEKCTGCGRVSPVVARTAGGPWCRYCRPGLTASCFLCGRTRACEISQVTGRPWCDACKQYWSRCAGCGTFAPIYAGTRARPLCARCHNPDPEFWNRCPVCTKTWQLGTVPCKRCALSRKITDRLSDGTGSIRDGLGSLHQALMAVERPQTAWDWLDMPRVRALMAALGRDDRPLTHQILDQLPASNTLHHLRSVLVATGALPARDERLVHLERWIIQAVETRDTAGERQILHRYAVWHMLRKLRQRHRAAAGWRGRAPDALPQTTKRQAAYVRRHVLAATAVFDLMREQDLTLASLTQPDLDRWTAEHRFTYPQATAHFVRWAVASNHATGLKPPGPRPASRNGPYDTERRWADARRLLHDATLKLSDRVAGLLVLLYAQHAADVAGLTAADVHDDGTEVTLMLGTEPIILPEPLAWLMRELVATRRGHATIGRPRTVPWLFPGGRPGHSLSGDRLGERLRNIGMHPREDRATALFALATELPAAVLARMLGLSIHTAVDWQQITSGDWMTYAADVSRRKPRQPASQPPQDRPS